MLTRIALAQMAVSPGKLEPNFKRGLEFINDAAVSGSNYVLFPELWTSGYPIQSLQKVSQSNLEFVHHLQKVALEKKILIGGSFLIRDGKKFCNRYLLITPEGELPAAYDKIHLFKPLKEDQFLASGSKLSIFKFQQAIIGLSICYDLRFPELFRAYSAEDVNLLLLAAEWPLSRIGHWKVLVQARAIENQAFLAAVKSVGITATDTFGGNSMLVDPNGNVLCSGNDTEECLMIIDCDLTAADTYRDRFPVLDSQRKDLFNIHQR